MKCALITNGYNHWVIEVGYKVNEVSLSFEEFKRSYKYLDLIAVLSKIIQYSDWNPKKKKKRAAAIEYQDATTKTTTAFFGYL